MADVFGKVIDFLNTPMPGSKRRTKPTVEVPAATGKGGKPPASTKQRSAVDLQAELRKRDLALKAAQEKTKDQKLRRELAASRAELIRTRRRLEKELAKQAKDHSATEKWTYTVAPGDTLSGIAKKHYGKASLWPKVYEANKDKIENPNLIFPGQVLVMPDIDG